MSGVEVRVWFDQGASTDGRERYGSKVVDPMHLHVAPPPTRNDGQAIVLELIGQPRPLDVWLAVSKRHRPRLVVAGETFAAFETGDPGSDAFVRAVLAGNDAEQQQVAITSGDGELVGLAAARVVHVAGLTLLLRTGLAVSRRAQGQGIGLALLHAIMCLTSETGCAGLLVEADPMTETFYAGLGFVVVDLLWPELAAGGGRYMFLERGAMREPRDASERLAR